MNEERRPSGPATDPESVGAEVEAIQNHWDRTIRDLEATAESYRERDWSVLELHPGDVVALGPDGPDRWGLDLLLPDNEFRDLERWVNQEATAFDSCEVLRGSGDGILFLVIAMEDAATERAILFPAYYDLARATGMLEMATSADEMRCHLRPLTSEPIITFTIDDPELVTPTD